MMTKFHDKILIVMIGAMLTLAGGFWVQLDKTRIEHGKQASEMSSRLSRLEERALHTPDQKQMRDIVSRLSVLEANQQAMLELLRRSK